jgi:4-hydroxybenzoate polyprenyltransferase
VAFVRSGAGAAAAFLVRWWAWWFNKVPLSVTLVLLLVDGRRFSGGVLAVLVLVVLTVCAAGNYGYALNDLFDVEEDRRVGRANAVAASGARRMWAIIIVSAACAEALATTAAGLAGALITVAEIALPAAYSIPPVRFKERRWLGVAADGLAAHVYPAVLALIAVDHWSLRPLTTLLAVSVAVWAAAAGARGILSHQLHTAERDAAAGLRTVVHDLGARRLERAIAFGLIPLEAAGLGGALVACDGGIVLWTGAGLYLLYEAYKTLSGRFRVTAFRPQGQRYIPFAEESFYKSWGPLVLALDCARADLRYLLLLPAYALLFRPHLRTEWSRLRAVTDALRTPRATERDARSSGGA